MANIGMPIATVTQDEVDDFIMRVQANDLSSVVKYLAKFGSAISNRLDSHNRLPALYYAVSQCYQHEPKQQLQLIDWLIAAGGSLYFLDLYSNSFLYHACHDDRLPVFDFLLDQGLSPLSKNVFGQSLLFRVAKENHVRMFHHLLEKDIEFQVNEKDYMGRTPLFYAAEQGHFEICSQLVREGASCCISDTEDFTPAHYARRNRMTSLALFLDSVRKTELEKDKDNNGTQTKSEDEQSIPPQKYNICLLDKDDIPRRLTEDQVLQLLRSHPELLMYLREPELLLQDGENTPGLRWQQKAGEILQRCIKMPQSVPFRSPVNQQQYGITDYYVVVTHPMDLGTIRTKLTHNAYETSEGFVRDVHLVFENCLLYNGSAHPIAQSARRLKAHFDSICSFD